MNAQHESIEAEGSTPGPGARCGCRPGGGGNWFLALVVILSFNYVGLCLKGLSDAVDLSSRRQADAVMDAARTQADATKAATRPMQWEAYMQCLAARSVERCRLMEPVGLAP